MSDRPEPNNGIKSDGKKPPRLRSMGTLLTRLNKCGTGVVNR